MILTNFGVYNPIIVFYGSNIYNESSSDLDVCLIFNQPVDNQLKQEIINKTIQFQRESLLRIDEEIPFDNKLIYTLNELEDVFIDSPFRDGDNFKLDEIVKTQEFLSSG